MRDPRIIAQKLGSEVCAAKSSDGPNPYFAHNIYIIIIRPALGKGTFLPIINYTLCVILGVSLDFWAEQFLCAVYVNLGHYLTPCIKATLIRHS